MKIAKSSGAIPCVLAIDPGATGTGLSWWIESEWDKLVMPMSVLNIYPPGGQATRNINSFVFWTKKVDYIMARLCDHLDSHSYPITGVCCEYPEYFGTVGRGAIAAKEGDLVKLSFMVGSIAEALRQRNIPARWITPQQWKGQLPKVVVERRIKEILPSIATLGVKSHSWDSVGIGLYAKGYFSVKNTGDK